MIPHQLYGAGMDPTRIFRAQGMTADPWQRDVLMNPGDDLLLCCSRGAGKTRVTSALALVEALYYPGSLILLVSRTQRQAVELLRYVKQSYYTMKQPLPALRNNEHAIEIKGGSRIIALPGREDTVRSYQGVNLLIVDEAARVDEELYKTINPMIGTSGGRRVCLSTPYGQRGFFWEAWNDHDGRWKRFSIPWQRCPRLSASFIEEERRQFGDNWVAQEYECSFSATEGLVYPDFEQCVVWGEWKLPEHGTRIGGIDWGFRNPFAAIWGIHDKDDVLWIDGERYCTQTPLYEHAEALPKQITWYADPSGATEIKEMLAAGHVVRKANNDIRAGIQAVTARLQTGRLKINGHGCPNLVNEAKRYRYPQSAGERGVDENPIDDNNHALGALRYLISRLDTRVMARFRRTTADEHNTQSPSSADRWNDPSPDSTGGASSERTLKERMKDPSMWR